MKAGRLLNWEMECGEYEKILSSLPVRLIIGVVIGIFAIAKLIEILLAKWKCITYGAILGLVVASPFAILMGLSLPGFNLVQVIVSVLTFILGFAAAWLLARKDEKPAA